MTIEPKPIDAAFMYFPIRNLKDDRSKLFLAHNITNSVGYLPFVGTKAGIVRIIFPLIAYQREKDKLFKDLSEDAWS